MHKIFRALKYKIRSLFGRTVTKRILKIMKEQAKEWGVKVQKVGKDENKGYYIEHPKDPNNWFYVSR